MSNEVEVFDRALASLERLPCPGTLERAIGHLVRGGVELARVRGWAQAKAEAYGIWPYVRPDFERMMSGAANLRAEM